MTNAQNAVEESKKNGHIAQHAENFSKKRKKKRQK